MGNQKHKKRRNIVEMRIERVNYTSTIISGLETLSNTNILLHRNIVVLNERKWAQINPICSTTLPTIFTQLQH